ncbi:MAG: nitrilase-related carbon-nitrogen hydrolase, partial [Pseudomonadota bacterium]
TIVYSEGVPPFVAMICYEGLYPNVTRAAQDAAGHRADWIVLISNDGWFGSLIGPSQHYAQNRYRAIETGLPMARVAARGASAIIDGKGREVLETKGLVDDIEGWRGQLGRGKLPEPEAVTFYLSRGGQILFPFTLVLFSVFAFFIWRR